MYDERSTDTVVDQYQDFQMVSTKKPPAEETIDNFYCRLMSRSISELIKYRKTFWGERERLQHCFFFFVVFFNSIKKKSLGNNTRACTVNNELYLESTLLTRICSERWNGSGNNLSKYF